MGIIGKVITNQTEMPLFIFYYQNTKYTLLTYRDLAVLNLTEGFPGDSDSKVSACKAGELALIPGSGRYPGEWNGNPLQYSCLEDSMDWEAGRLQSVGSQRVKHNWATSLSCSFKFNRKWSNKLSENRYCFFFFSVSKSKYWDGL